jgi:hypothetical protein
MPRLRRAPGRRRQPRSPIPRVAHRSLRRIEPNARRRAPQLIFERLVALLDARHQRRERLDQLNAELFDLKGHVVLSCASVSLACEP